MISDAAVARKISGLMLEFGERLNESVADVAAQCPTNELMEYRRAVGTVMGEMLLQIMNPLFRAHPDIKPVELQ